VDGCKEDLWKSLSDPYRIGDRAGGWDANPPGFDRTFVVHVAPFARHPVFE